MRFVRSLNCFKLYAKQHTDNPPVAAGFVEILPQPGVFRYGCGLRLRERLLLSNLPTGNSIGPPVHLRCVIVSAPAVETKTREESPDERSPS